uniref:60S ribosomal protein L36 n=1 Tax=Steinernema glaseri TaxID=37863 RepID=A0A1I7Z560_9BILA
MVKAIEGLATGLEKGFPVTKNVRKTRQSRHKGKVSKKTKVVRELVREVCGFAPYERRTLELLRIGKDKKYSFYMCCRKDKKALKYLKKRIGKHAAAKRKRDEMQTVIAHSRKHHK